MKPITLTKSQARKIILHAAGLSRPAQFGKGIAAVSKMIDHLGFLQIDSNTIIERAHHHSIFSRVQDYDPAWLGKLEADKKIFEFWTFAAGYMPMEAFRFSLPVKESFARRKKDLKQTEINLMRSVLDRIAREGPLTSNDFENDRATKSKGWWDWKPSKIALDRLNLFGELTTTRRKDFRKVYDLTENSIPVDVDRTVPTLEEYTRHVIFRSLRAFGVAYPKEIAFTTRYVKTDVKSELESMADAGEISRVEIKGLKGPLYTLPEYSKKKITLSGEAFILSPFDVLNVFRHRLRDFFDFDYQIECFVPAAKRKYGYFSLPILIGDTFVARMDSKADRKARILIVTNLHFESVKLTKAKITKLREALRKFASFNQCDTIVIKKSNDRMTTKFLLNYR